MADEPEISAVESSVTPTLNTVYSVQATPNPDVYRLLVNLTDMRGETYDANFVSTPTDMFGLGPTVRQWLLDNPETPIEPYVPPTTEEVRAAMPPISRRQLRLALVRNGVSIASVEAIIAAMPDGQAKEEAQIEWSDATMFERTHPTLLAVGMALGLSEEAVDAMWTQASAI